MQSNAAGHLLLYLGMTVFSHGICHCMKPSVGHTKSPHTAECLPLPGRRMKMILGFWPKVSWPYCTAVLRVSSTVLWPPPCHAVSGTDCPISLMPTLAHSSSRLSTNSCMGITTVSNTLAASISSLSFQIVMVLRSGQGLSAENGTKRQVIN